jgi:hypothetical protein
VTRRVIAAAAALVGACAALVGCSAAPASGSAVVSFRVADQEEFAVRLDDERIPSGVIVRDGDGGVNSPWTWHLDPSSIEFADLTTEVCDGLPSFVEDGSLTSDRYCPWSAEVLSVEPLED